MVWSALVPSGTPWLDTELGGFPATSVLALQAGSGAGKTSFALANALAALRRGPVCMVTNEAPETVLETALGAFEVDLKPAIRNGAFSILSFAPFFVNKVRSLNSVEAPLAELGEYLREKQIRHVVIDTLDPALSWIEAANAKLSVRVIMAQLRGWNMGVFCTLGADTPVTAEFARTASGSLELTRRDALDSDVSQAGSRLLVKHAGWCNVYGAEARVNLVQGRGFVVNPRAPTRQRSSADHGNVVPHARPEAPKEPLFPTGQEAGAFTLIGDPRERDAAPGTLVVSQPVHAAHSPPQGSSVPPVRSPYPSAPRPATSLAPKKDLGRTDRVIEAVAQGPATVRIQAAVPIEDSAPTIVRPSEFDEEISPESERTVARPALGKAPR